MMPISVLGVIILVLWRFDSSNALNNGLALTPPMGFNTWERYRCTTDCTNFPDACINEKLIRKIADLMKSEGYVEAGYEYLVIDDCWLAEKRSVNGELQPSKMRFPNGMKSLVEYFLADTPSNMSVIILVVGEGSGVLLFLYPHEGKFQNQGEADTGKSASYVHAKGLKFGIYGNFGERTCAGYPGIKENLQMDADLFAKEWEVDFVKLDGCFSDVKAKAIGYPEFGRHLNKSGRPIVYSCSWPSYLIDLAITPNYTALVETCNLWRNYDDVEDSWASVLNIIDYYAKEQDAIDRFHGPGHWHDADMLIIGNFGLSYEQSRSQMAIWCVMGVPLFMSTDLTKMRPELKKILLNEIAIKINQDPLGKFGRRISNKKGVQIWRRAILPQQHDYYSFAIAILNGRVDGSPLLISRNLEQLGLYNPNGYRIEDVFQGTCATVKPKQTVTSKIPPSGVVFWKFTVITDDSTDQPCSQYINKRQIKSLGPYYVYTVGLIYVLGIGSLMMMFLRGTIVKRALRVVKV